MVHGDVIDTVVVGGGQAGLAMSRCLVQRDVPHVVLERGRIVERWQSERWDSLRLLTPNWMTRLPGDYYYRGNDPDGYMTASETVQFFQNYANSFDAPIRTHSEVVRVERNVDDSTLQVTTKSGQSYKARNVVIATGFCDQPRVPDYAMQIPSGVLQLGPSDYHRPRQLPRGPVLVVGASATGCQIAQELMNYSTNNDSYFDKVILSVGRHSRLPRLYRGKDILYWMEAIGYFRQPCEASKERETPGPPIIGTPEHSDLDLLTLQSQGIQLVGRALGVKQTSLHTSIVVFKEDLHETMSAAEIKLMALLKAIDNYIEQEGIEAPLPAQPIAPVPVPSSPATEVSLDDIRTIVWATGYERKYPWLEVSMPNVLDENGDIRHKHGVVTAESGMYVLGMRFEMTRISNFIDGVGADAEQLADMIVQRRRSSDKSKGEQEQPCRSITSQTMEQ